MSTLDELIAFGDDEPWPYGGIESFPEGDEPPEDDCMDCGMCDSCIARTKAFYEEMEREERTK